MPAVVELDRGSVEFRCNVCGTDNNLSITAMTRETGFCRRCRSSVRMRAGMYALSLGLFGSAKCLTEFPRLKNILGVGLSDWEGYAKRLRRCFTYHNTFFDRRPKFDIQRPPKSSVRYHFVTALDVLEHVPPPVHPAFNNLASLITSDGLIILSVPYSLQQATVEHFPNLNKYLITEHFGSKCLINQKQDGSMELFTNLSFHGGHGRALEMRVFSRNDLLLLLNGAGLSSVSYVNDVPEWGIIYENECSRVLMVRR